MHYRKNGLLSTRIGMFKWIVTNFFWFIPWIAYISRKLKLAACVSAIAWSSQSHGSIRLESRFLVTRTRLESRWKKWWLDSSRVTFFTEWLGSSHFYKISEFLMDKATSFAHKEMSIFLLQWWSRLAEMFCFACLVVVCCIIRISFFNLHWGRPETLLSLRGQQVTIYWYLIMV